MFISVVFFQQMYRLAWVLKISTSGKGTRDSSRKNGLIVETHKPDNSKCESTDKISYCPRPSHAATAGISNDSHQRFRLEISEGGNYSIKAGSRISRTVVCCEYVNAIITNAVPSYKKNSHDHRDSSHVCHPLLFKSNEQLKAKRKLFGRLVLVLSISALT